jgi:hypothetical protein
MCVTITERYYCGCEYFDKIVVCADMKGKKGLCPNATTELSRAFCLCRACNECDPRLVVKTPQKALVKTPPFQPSMVAAPVAISIVELPAALGLRGGEDRRDVVGDCSCCCGSIWDGCCESCTECGEVASGCVIM